MAFTAMAWGALTICLAWGTADLHALPGPAGSLGTLLIFCLGGAVSGAFMLVVLIAGAPGLLLLGRGGTDSRLRLGLAATLPAAGLSLGYWFAVRNLFSGPRISTWEWHAPALWATLLIGMALIFCICLVILHMLSTRLRASAAILALALLPLLAWADRALLPAYAAFHLMVVVAFVLDAGLLGLWMGSRTRVAPRVAVSLSTLLFVAGLFVLATGAVANSDRAVRETLLIRAPFSARLLKTLSPILGTPTRDEDPPGASEATWSRLPNSIMDRHFPNRKQWNLVIITLDAVRADHVSCQGYKKPTTPNLDRFARGAVLFENAYAQYPSSQLSLASMFTGLYASGTSMSRLRYFRRAGQAAHKDPLLSSRLQSHGLGTRAVTAFNADQLERLFWYLPIGFDTFTHGPPGRWLDGNEIADRAIVEIDGLGQERFFLWIHLFDPHAPYAQHPHTEGNTDMDAYDGEITFADAQMQRILTRLAARPDWDNTVVVVHSDHGEEFMEHGHREHNSSVHEEQVRVPLMIRVPDTRGRRIRDPVELLDLPATFEELFDLAPLPRDHGQSLVPYFLPPSVRKQADVTIPPPLAFTQLRDRNLLVGRLDAVRFGDEKLIYNLDADIYQLFNLATDPAEQRDRSLSDPDTVARLRLHLAACRRSARPPQRGQQGQRRTRRRTSAESKAAETKAAETEAIDAGLAGDPRFEARLQEIMAAPDGQRRMDALLALARLDHPALRHQANLLFEWGLLGGERAVRAMKVLADVKHAAFPFSCYVTPRRPDLPAAFEKTLLDSVLRHGRAVLPFVRRALAGSDLRLRERARTWLRETSTPGVEKALLDAERKMSAARQLAQEEDNLQQARKLALEAFHESERLGAPDWGLALETWTLLLTDPDLDRRTRAFATVMSAWGSADPTVTEFLSRLEKIARQLPGSERPKLLLGAVTIPGDRKPLALLRLELPTGGTALPGGRASHLPHFSVAATARSTGEHFELLRLPIPIAGILPGETLEIPMPIPVEALPVGEFEITVLLSWGQKLLCAPVTFPVRKG